MTKKIVSIFVVVWLSVLSPAVSFAQEATGPIGETGSSNTGPTEETGTQECTGAGCGQGAGQGVDQGVDQGVAQGDGADITATNSNTGEDSTNANTSDTNTSANTSVTNTATDTTNATASGNTGQNSASGNTGSVTSTSGQADLGVTSVKNDNTAVIGGSANLEVNTYNGDQQSLTLGQGAGAAADLSGGASYQITNEATGAGSTNTADISTHTEETTEVQNDGKILNDIEAFLNTGKNDASGNTGDAKIVSGPADMVVTLLNLLNVVVDNGHLLIEVAEIFGNLMGDIVVSDLSGMASRVASGMPDVTAVNEQTGENSTNTIDLDLIRTETTKVVNDADITTNVDGTIITGQNDATANTGGATVMGGDAAMSLGNISLANVTIEGGNWSLIIVDARNGWVGFLVSDGGQVLALSREETIQLVNSQTGANSDNTIDVTDERERTTEITNDAEIVNNVRATVNTGQNTATGNTGEVTIESGDAALRVDAINFANIVVKDATLLIGVVKIFGDWFGELLYQGHSLLAATGQGGAAVIDGANSQTGAGSENMIDVSIDRSHTTEIDNKAKIATNLTVDIDTGNNTADKNTGKATVESGNGNLVLHSRAMANLTGVTVDQATGLTMSGLNDTTGFDSTNKIKATLNDERIISIDNFANVSTFFGAIGNTGHNTASFNTLGAEITSGDFDANVGIHNWVNRVMLALADEAGLATADRTGIIADFLNRLTGALSENSNQAEVDYNFLANILNHGLVDNVIDLLFTTGDNQAIGNTAAASISTGHICFEGQVENTVNKNTLGLGGLFSISAESNAAVNNDANIQATTGNNQLNNNTGGGQAGDSEPCELAQAPIPTPTATPTPGLVGGPVKPSEDGHGPSGQGAGEVEEGKVAAAHLAQGKPGRINGGKILRRFPVAGSLVESQWLAGAKRPIWPAVVLGAMGILGLAYHLDRQAKLRRARLTLAAR